MPEITWNAPVVARPLTENESTLLVQQTQAIGSGTTASAIPSANRFVYFAAFDGTNNNRENLALSGDSQETNIGTVERLVRQQAVNVDGLASAYFAGPGTELSRINSSWAPPKVTAEVVDIAQRAYDDYARSAKEWLSDPANQGRTLDGAAAAVTGFSRGCAAAVVFSQMLNENGLVHPDGTVLIPRGQAGVGGMALIDPVYTGVKLDLSIPPNVTSGNIVVLQALDEFRTAFQAADYSNDPRVKIVEVFGNHCDLGGCYPDQGIGALTLAGLGDFFTNIGIPVGAIPPERTFSPESSSQIHTSAVDVNGQEIWSAYGMRPVDSTESTRLFEDVVAPHAHYNTKDWDFVRSSPWLFAFATVAQAIATTFNNFSKYPQRTDPFTLDLDGDGIETVGVNATHPLLFDIDAVGVKKSVGWVKADDGLLALDRNGNGTIDSGAELFGNATPVFDSSGHLVRQAVDGFDALAQQDSNADGVIDALDTNWSTLRVWQDANQDGISQASELKTLDALNITAIHLAKVENSVPLANGNVLADLGSFTRSDGSQGGAGTAAQLADIDLATDSFHSQFADSIPLTVEADALPDIQGSGQVRSLRQAASMDTAAGHALGALLTQYSQATSKAAQMALLDPLLKGWSDTSTMATTFTGAYAGHALTVDMQGVWSPDNVSNPGTAAYQAWAAKLTIMEHFNGRTYQQVPDGTAPVTITLWHSPRDMLQLSYEALKTSVYDSLALQTRLKPYLDSIQLTITETGIGLDFSQVKADFTAKIDSDPANGLADLMDFNAGTREMLAGSGWNGTDLIVDYLGTHAMTAQLQAAFAGTGILVKGTTGWSNSGTAGDDVMIADGANDVLFGNGAVWGNKSRRWRDGERSAFHAATNDAMFAMRSAE